MTFRLAAIDARYPTVVQLVVSTGVEYVCLRVLFASGPASCAAAEHSFKAILGPSHTAHAIHNTLSINGFIRNGPFSITCAYGLIHKVWLGENELV